MYEEKLAEAEAKMGLTRQGPMRPTMQVLTLDEALAYFQELRKIQDAIEARERDEKFIERLTK